MSSSSSSHRAGRSRSANTNTNTNMGQAKVTSFFARAKSHGVPAASSAANLKSGQTTTKSILNTSADPVPPRPSSHDTEVDEEDAILFSQEFDGDSDDQSSLSGSNDGMIQKGHIIASTSLATPVASSSPNAAVDDGAPKTRAAANRQAAHVFKTPAPKPRRSRFSPPPTPHKPNAASASEHGDGPGAVYSSRLRSSSPVPGAPLSSHALHAPSSADATMALLFGAKKAPSRKRRDHADASDDEGSNNEPSTSGSRRSAKLRRKDILKDDLADSTNDAVADESIQWAITFISSYLSAPDDRATVMSQLRRFDLDFKYGPTVGIPRLTRWLRASERGLSPDPHIGNVLRAVDMVLDMPVSRAAKVMGMDVSEVHAVKGMARNVFAEYGTLV